MADNKDIQSQQDRIRVNKNEKYEVDYLQEQFPNVSREEIMRVIDEKGPMREDIMEALRGRKG